jgi:AcrR family transcriptional regulator
VAAPLPFLHHSLMARKSLAPQQARSRESERRLRTATLKVLATQGLEGTTIPRIAAEAGLTPGAVYRRFPDKTALLETVLLCALEDNHEQVRQSLTPALAQKHSLAGLAGGIIGSLIATYRTQTHVIRALRQLLLTGDHQAFRSKAIGLEQRSKEHLIEVLLTYRKEIRHPDPQLALSLALTVLINALLEIFLVDVPLGLWPAFVPEDDTVLRRELTRMFLSYLGCADA